MDLKSDGGDWGARFQGEEGEDGGFGTVGDVGDGSGDGDVSQDVVTGDAVLGYGQHGATPVVGVGSRGGMVAQQCGHGRPIVKHYNYIDVAPGGDQIGEGGGSLLIVADGVISAAVILRQVGFGGINGADDGHTAACLLKRLGVLAYGMPVAGNDQYAQRFEWECEQVARSRADARRCATDLAVVKLLHLLFKVIVCHAAKLQKISETTF